MKTATCLEKHLDGWQGHANFYKMDPPIEYETSPFKRLFGFSRRYRKTEWVIVSTTHMPEGLSTFIFPCTYKKRVLSWTAIPGSQRDTADHQQVLLNAGYLMRP